MLAYLESEEWPWRRKQQSSARAQQYLPRRAPTVALSSDGDPGPAGGRYRSTRLTAVLRLYRSNIGARRSREGAESLQMSGENRNKDHRKLAAGIVCGGILLAGLAAGSYWHRAAATATSASKVSVGRTSVASAEAARLSLVKSRPVKLAPIPKSSPHELQFATSSSPAISPVARAQAISTYAALPMTFEANHGQTDARVKFLSRAPGYTLFLADKEAVLSIADESPLLAAARARQPSPSSPGLHGDKSESPHTVRLKFLGGRAATAITGRDQLATKSNYFIGNDPKQWRTNVPNYSAVEYRGIYSGVDAVFHGDNRRLELDFDLAPGADPNSIALEIEGAQRIRLNRAGDVVLGMDATRDVVMGKPLIHQQSPEGRRKIAGHYVLAARNRIAFELGPYDHTQPLVIDPTLDYSTYLGGGISQESYANAIAVDSSGCAYVAGTAGADTIPFPTTSGSYNPGPVPTTANFPFITKLNIGSCTGPTNPPYSTYFGGDFQGYSSDEILAIAVDSSGEAYFGGISGTEDNTPTTPGSFMSVRPSQKPVPFVAKLSADGSKLIYSTFLDGTPVSSGDALLGIAVDSSDSAYVTGVTTASNFPLQNPYQSTNKASYYIGTAFVTKLSADGSQLVYSTFLGGSYGEDDSGATFGTGAIAVDASDSAYVTGVTLSSDFPTTTGVTCSSPCDEAFVSKFNKSGGLVYSTLLGGKGSKGSVEWSVGFGIAVDSSGSAFVGGKTTFTDFPLMNPLQSSAGPGFITKLSPDGTTLVYSSYFNGYVESVAVGPDDSAVIFGLGNTSFAFESIDALSIPACTTSSCFYDFLSKLTVDGTGLLFSSPIGANQECCTVAGALDPAGNAYIAGSTSSLALPTTAGSFEPSLPSNYTGFTPFAAKVSPWASTSLAILPATIPPGTEGTAYSPVAFTAPSATGTVTFALIAGSLPPGLTFTSAGALSGTPTMTGTFPFTVTAFDSNNNTGSQSYSLQIAAPCPTITVVPNTLPNDVVGTVYPAVTFTANGGVPPITFSETGLPTGIGMSFVGGVLSGTPIATESSLPITVTAIDSNQCVGSVNDTLTISSGSIPPAVVTDNEAITVTDTEMFPDVADSETITVTDGVTITPLISVAAPVASFSTSSLGFGTVAEGSTGTQTITVSNVGEGQTGLALSGAVITPSGTPFSIGAIACSNGASSLAITLPSGGACMVTISYAAPASGTPPSAAIAFTDNAALSNLTSTPSGPSYVQTISLNGTGTTAPQPTEPPATVPVSDNETITVTDSETFPDVPDSETITVSDQASVTVSQTITSGAAPTVVVGGSGTLSATASSGLPVTFNSTTPTICSVTGSSVTGLAVGSCIVAANQAGNATYSPAPQVTQTISINPSAGLYPTTLTFADQLVGSTSATQTVTLTNAGTAKLTVGTITTTTDFTHPSKTCTATLAAGSSCTISVAFAPKAAGALSGTLTVGTNGTVALSGTGIVPSASITPATYTFANQQVDTTSKVQTFTYSNTGLVSITVSSVTLSGAAAANYVIASDPCTGVTLSPAATCDVGVTFTPSAANKRVATLTVTDETGGAVKTTASLSGMGVAATASLTGTAAFGNQQVGVTSAAQTLTYQNTGLGAISVNSAALSGNAATDYVIATDTCTGTTLAASATCSIGVTFTPSAVGSRVASLTVTDSTGGAKAQSLSLNGTGIAPTISLGSGTYAYGAVTVATAATFTLTNSGTAPLVINTIALTTGTRFQVTGDTCLVGGSVSNGSSCTVIVTFTPSGTTTFADTLTIQGTGVGAGAPKYTASRAMTGH